MGKLIKNNKCLEEGVSPKDLEGLQGGVAELQGKIEEINRLIREINTTLGNKMGYSGGSFTGQVGCQNLIPTTDRAYILGSEASLWKEAWIEKIVMPYTQILSSSEYSLFAVLNGMTIRNNTNIDTFMPISASAFNVMSSRRYKKNIREMTEEEANKLDEVAVVIFDYKNKENGVNVAGMIAEDVYKVLPNVVTMTEVNGEMVPDSIDYAKFAPYFLKKFQMLEKRICNLENKEV